MKTFKFLMPFLLVAFTFVGCDTDDLRNDIDELKNRVESLEAQVSAINDNMNALKVFVDGGKTISSYEETENGYKLVLSDNTVLNITQGQPGQVDVPEITIQNGNWYIEGQDTGEKAVGADATLPQFTIKEYTPDGGTAGYYWYVGDKLVLDGAGKPVLATTSHDVTIEQDFFESVTVDDATSEMVLVLKTSDGTAGAEYRLPIVEGLKCAINTENLKGYKDGVLTMGFGEILPIEVEISEATYILTAPAGWTAELSEPKDGKATLTLTAPASAPASTLSRAVADNTKDVVIQVNKGVNWAVDKIQVVADEIIESYYALYEKGETFEIAGIKINNQLYTQAQFVESNADISDDNTVYFIKPGQDIVLNYVKTSANLGNTIIIGDDPSQKSSFVINEQYIKLKEVDTSNSLFLCHNVEITANQKNYSIINYGHMNKVIFDNCTFKLCTSQPFYSNSSSDPKTQLNRYIDEFVISNSVLDFAGCTKNFFVSDGLAYPQFGIVLKNNIFYSSGEDYVMRLFSLKLATVSFTMENNTFYKVTSSTNAYFYSAKLSNVTVKNNIFYSEKFTGNNLILRASTEGTFKFDFTGVTCLVENNVGVKGNYTSTDGEKTSIWQVFYGGDKPTGCTDITNLEVGVSPFEFIDVQSLTFTPKSEYSGYGATIE